MRCLSTTAQRWPCRLLLVFWLVMLDGGAAPVVRVTPEADDCAFAWSSTISARQDGDATHLCVIYRKGGSLFCELRSPKDRFSSTSFTQTIDLKASRDPPVRGFQTSKFQSPFVSVSSDGKTFLVKLALPAAAGASSASSVLGVTFSPGHGDPSVWFGANGDPVWVCEQVLGEPVMLPGAFVSDRGSFKAFSPDGRLVCIVAYGFLGAVHPDSLLICKPNQARVKVLFSGPVSLSPANPVWSPGSDLVAAGTWTSGILVGNVRTGKVLRLYDENSGYCLPLWISEKQLSVQNGSNLYLITVKKKPLARTAVRRIASNLPSDGKDPGDWPTPVRWSDDARFFAYLREGVVTVLENDQR